MLSEAVQIALISGVSGVLAGFLGTRGADRLKNGKHGAPGYNGNGSGSIERAISSRAEVEFQTKMTLLMGQLTAAIEKGNERAAGALSDAASAIKSVHEEIVAHRAETKPAMGAVFDTRRTVDEIRRQIERNPIRTGTGG